MENHPIPQDVTGFKFKLIGSVTVKQFLYLMGGAILAFVCFALPITPFIKYPLSLLFGGVGAALAFIPIEGRPMDVMMKNFLKALPAENQFIFRKKGAEALISEFFSPPTVVATPQQQAKSAQTTSALDQKRALLFQTLKQSYKPDEKEEAVLSNISTYLNESSHSTTPPMQNLDTLPDTSSMVKVATPNQPIDMSAAVKVVMPTKLPQETPIAKPSPTVQAAEASELTQQQQELATPPAPVPAQPEPQTPHVEIAPPDSIAAPSTPYSSTPSSRPTPVSVNPNESQNVTAITAEGSLKAGFPQLPDTPNIVMGIIKDPRGRVLPNVLVEIMDVQGIPVRAFKTNALGQFAAATPLPNGEYNVVLEDPRKQNEFEQIHIVLDGKIFQPLEIISVDQREKLRRELFGAQSVGAQSVGARASI